MNFVFLNKKNYSTNYSFQIELAISDDGQNVLSESLCFLLYIQNNIFSKKNSKFDDSNHILLEQLNLDLHPVTNKR